MESAWGAGISVFSYQSNSQPISQLSLNCTVHRSQLSVKKQRYFCVDSFWPIYSYQLNSIQTFLFACLWTFTSFSFPFCTFCYWQLNLFGEDRVNFFRSLMDLNIKRRILSVPWAWSVTTTCLISSMVTQYIYFYQLKEKRGDTTFAEDLSINYIGLKVSNSCLFTNYSCEITKCPNGYSVQDYGFRLCYISNPRKWKIEFC